jgi:hypothetical protein
MTYPRDIKHVVELHTNEGPNTCPICDKDFRIEPGSKMDDAINHLIEHGYELLHVGAERDDDPHTGHSIHHTVAILGTTKEVKTKAKPVVKIGWMDEKK